ncbi:hypothetical protein O181_012134 [Austropuccinia psidii MF-1]|uniref:Reverse transcriptase domain-containing protein n=1 Tax=Austropuccinia psidii MF-1 TaxID=1389203 RepID=A0A9Q3GMJ9_9BASI|nr:hypothetical protein [Austropuccinia psidii MF-1]
MLITARFNTLFTRSAHRWYIKIRQAHGHQSWTWWKTQIIDQWANDSWRFKVKTSFESAKINAYKDKSLPLFFQQKYRLTVLYPDMLELMIHRKIQRQCEGDLEHADKRRTNEKSSEEDIINILEEVTTRTRIGSSWVNLKKRFNTPWKDYVDKNTKGSSNKMNSHPIEKQESELSSLLYDHKEAFASDKEPLGEIVGHEVDIILNIERPYPPLLRRSEYPESPKSREELELHIKELLDLGVIRKVGHNEEGEITSKVIVGWHNEKSRMAGHSRALSTYTFPDRYPIPKIQIALTQIFQAVYISTMDSLKGFNQTVVTQRARKYLRIIVHCGVYEYLRMPFGIKNAPSQFQRMMNDIFDEISEGWLITYIDDIIVCSKTWEEHIYRSSRVLGKIQSVSMEISLKKCHSGFKELKSLGPVVSGISLGTDKNKVAAVLLKPIPQNKKEIQ